MVKKKVEKKAEKVVKKVEKKEAKRILEDYPRNALGERLYYD